MPAPLDSETVCECPPVCGRQRATAVPLVRTWNFLSQGKYLSRRWNLSDIFRSCSPSLVSLSLHLLQWHFHIQIRQEQWRTCLIEALRTYASSHRLVRPTGEADETKGPTSHCGKWSQSLNRCGRNGCWGFGLLVLMSPLHDAGDDIWTFACFRLLTLNLTSLFTSQQRLRFSALEQ